MPTVRTIYAVLACGALGLAAAAAPVPASAQVSGAQAAAGAASDSARDARIASIHERFVFADIHAHPSRFHRANVDRIGADEIERYRRGFIDLVVANISSDAAFQGGYTSRDGTRVRRLDGNDVHPIQAGAAFAFTLDRLDRILATVASGDAVLATSPDAVLSAKRNHLVAFLAALEGADGLENSIENLRELHRRGVRLVQLMHFLDNGIGSNQTPPYEERGLTEFGRELIREANRLGIIVDLAHANTRTIMDALEVSTAPILFSHTGVKALYDGDRYLTDAEIRAIAAKGGVIGIWPAAALDSIGGMVRHIDHVKALVGVDHIAIASDLRRSMASYIDAFGEEANFRAIARGLIDAGYTDDEIGKIMGGNFFRVWQTVVDAARLRYRARHAGLVTLAATAAACGQIGPLRPSAPEMPAIIPAPLSVTMPDEPPFRLDTLAVIVVEPGDAEARRIGEMLARVIGSTRELTPPVLEQPAGQGRAINLRIRPSDARLATEGYELVVAADEVSVTGGDAAGLFYGVQALRQLMPPAIEFSARRPTSLAIPAAHIVDRPRYEWRGMMLDVARHFLTPDDVKRFVDLLALYRMNRLHLHLSDDQGWRIEISRWPNLTAHGGSSAVGGHAGGYYTQEQFADLVEYARDRFVTIVPEIDMPGHINAALASYPQLNCDGAAPPLYEGTRVGFSALCVDKDLTYRFIDDVVGEISALIAGDYFHIGGDEVRRIPHEQYLDFVERAERIVASHGKRMIGWGEVAPAELPASAIIQHWRRPDSVARAVARGSRVILSPSSRVYLDMKYDESTPIGLSWAGTIDVRQAYDWEPALWLEGVPASAILGVEAPLWAETLGTVDDYEYMAFPRVVAVAELGWSEPERRDWRDFRRRLRQHWRRWEALGVNAYRAPSVW